MRPHATALAVAITGAALCGCGLVTLVHDTTLGPASPIGRIHDLTVGSDFRVTDTGPVADLAGEPLLRPYPADLLQRLARPSSFQSLAQGIEAFVGGVSPVVTRETTHGRAPQLEDGEAPVPGLAASEVLRRLGAPELWVRRKGGSLMLYRSQARRSFSFYVGVPPVAAALIPFPGAGNLRIRWTREDTRARKLLLFFDADDILATVVADAGP